MTNVTRIRNKYPENRAIQCICDAFDYPNAPIAMRARAPLKVLEALMWNRGVHMVLAGAPRDEIRLDNVDYERIWKDVIQMAIDVEIFDEDNIMVVKDVKETPNGILIWFDPPRTKSNRQTFRKKLLKIKRKFNEFDSWGNTILESYVP